MKIAVYYGGRGIIEDTTIYVVNKLIQVLDELNVTVQRYNLYEMKNEITMLPNTLKEVDAVVLAVSLEWYGIGGYMQTFLDACWLYADKENLKSLYMFPVVVATACGEQQVELMLRQQWELLGGMVCEEGICAYVENQAEFETSPQYAALIEKKAESFYRTVQRKTKGFPSSNLAEKRTYTPLIELTPQESEQLSKYVSDDTYVKKQKEDIEELSMLFKGMLERSENGSTDIRQEFLDNLRNNFHPPTEELNASYVIQMTDTGKTLVIEIDKTKMKCYYGEKEDADVIAKTTKSIVNKIVNGRASFQGAFMTGDISAKGDFKILRMFDQLFQFKVLG